MSTINDPSGIEPDSPIVIINIDHTSTTPEEQTKSAAGSNTEMGIMEVEPNKEHESEQKCDEEKDTKENGTNDKDIPRLKSGFNEPYYCQICMTTYPVNDTSFNPYKLKCGHIYCTECLFQFLYSKITDGEVSPKCFMKVETSSQSNIASISSRQFSVGLQPAILSEEASTLPDLRENSDFTSMPGPSIRRSGSQGVEQPWDPTQPRQAIGPSNSSQSFRGGLLTSSSHDSTQGPSYEQLVLHEISVQTQSISKDCGQPISDADIIELIKTDKNLVDKWQRFSFFHKNPNGRECPNITCRELMSSGSADSPNMKCPKCAQEFCFLHSTAHQNQSCADYTRSTQSETQLNSDFIEKTSRPCPSCGKRITKSGGCNHMRCLCGTAFCWLCGKEVDDSTFPVHFQWWNANGCSNMQMDPALEPTTTSIVVARISTAFQLVVFGPLTFISSALSIALCCCFLGHLWTPVPPKPGEPPSRFCTRLSEVFSSCLTGWGIFYMAIILGIPLGILSGAGFLLLIIINTIVYVVTRLYRKQYPWPDRVTAWCRRRYVGPARSPRAPPVVMRNPSTQLAQIRRSNRINNRVSGPTRVQGYDSRGSSRWSVSSDSNSDHAIAPTSVPVPTLGQATDSEEAAFEADLARAIAESLQSHIASTTDIEPGLRAVTTNQVEENKSNDQRTEESENLIKVDPPDEKVEMEGGTVSEIDCKSDASTVVFNRVVVVKIPEEQFAFLSPTAAATAAVAIDIPDVTGTDMDIDTEAYSLPIPPNTTPAESPEKPFIGPTFTGTDLRTRSTDFGITIAELEEDRSETVHVNLTSKTEQA